MSWKVSVWSGLHEHLHNVSKRLITEAQSFFLKFFFDTVVPGLLIMALKVHTFRFILKFTHSPPQQYCQIEQVSLIHTEINATFQIDLVK